MAWVRHGGVGSSTWHVYDDDAVSETDTEYVMMTLKGGGDDHMRCVGGGGGRLERGLVVGGVSLAPRRAASHLSTRAPPPRSYLLLYRAKA